MHHTSPAQAPHKRRTSTDGARAAQRTAIRFCSQMSGASHANRILDLAFEDGGTRGPLKGFFPSTLPVPSLDQALSQVAITLPHLHPVSGLTVKLARRHAKRAQRKYPHLSLDECASIVIYTIEEEPREGSLYYVLNGVLRAQERVRVRPWREYIWLLLHALRKLPVVDLVVVFRGCQKGPADLGLELEAGFDFMWHGFSSTATKQNVMQTFVGREDGPRTFLTLQLIEPVGRDVRDFSLYPGEEEVLIPPNVCFEIDGFCDLGHGLISVHCKQTETLDCILDMSPVPTPIASPPLPPPVAPSVGAASTSGGGAAISVAPASPSTNESDVARLIELGANSTHAQELLAQFGSLAVAANRFLEMRSPPTSSPAFPPAISAPPAPKPTVFSAPVAKPNEAAIAAFFKKVGGSVETVRGASRLDWSRKGLDPGDCVVIAWLASSGAMGISSVGLMASRKAIIPVSPIWLFPSWRSTRFASAPLDSMRTSV